MSLFEAIISVVNTMFLISGLTCLVIGGVIGFIVGVRASRRDP